MQLCGWVQPKTSASLVPNQVTITIKYNICQSFQLHERKPAKYSRRCSDICGRYPLRHYSPGPYREWVNIDTLCRFEQWPFTLWHLRKPNQNPVKSIRYSSYLRALTFCLCRWLSKGGRDRDRSLQLQICPRIVLNKLRWPNRRK